MDILCVVVVLGMALGVYLLVYSFLLWLAGGRQRPVDRVRSQIRQIKRDTLTDMHRAAREHVRRVEEQTKPYRR